ncbi:TetR/AcrR family transcriptional regulator [Streptomyces klenkii]|uniref:TetR/AcrR family transcriptional regulator n=1 Tax=Streptomyces klenkii TaxID=1420899 RepID=A0A3B0BTA9_9ACTN|nr:TetR/AcrR family transcriptional regulator [Streptomyces klenkii]RKN75489.1 TetR/AcrR family transcriptional regulator [Streptomyces klenkii]
MTKTAGAAPPASAAAPAPSAAAPPGTAERRGRPRNAALDSAVIETVLRLIEEGVPLGELSVERIAREAGVGKATVYRRWAGKEALMLDVMRSLEHTAPELAGESVRDDLVTLLETLRRRGLAKRSSAVLRTVLAQVKAHPELWQEYHEKVVRVRREAVHAVLRRGMATGEVRPDLDVELMGDLVVSPMLSRAMFHDRAELPEDLPGKIVDAVLEGIRPR